MNSYITPNNDELLEKKKKKGGPNNLLNHHIHSNIQAASSQFVLHSTIFLNAGRGMKSRFLQ